MTRHSASRGMLYSAPPGPEDDRTADVETDASAAVDTEPDAEPAAADD